MNDTLPHIATLFADPARAAMLKALIDGSERPAGELARAAHVSAQSASAHLAKLVEGGLLAAAARGRHRYFRLANPQVACAVESLAALGALVVLPRGVAPRAGALPEFARARTCNDHLAGELAVRVCEAMVGANWLVAEGRSFRVTGLGEEGFAQLGIDTPALRRRRRAFAFACLDVTERRAHVGGALGAALLDACLAQGWVLRSNRSRTLSITPAGSAAFARLFSVRQ